MSLLLASDVAAWLRYSATPTGAELTKLQETIDSAESYIAGKKSIGTILGPETITQRVDGGGCHLVLTTLPVISITSVTGADGAALVVANLDQDLQHGILGYDKYRSIEFSMPWYTVVYQAGFANLAALPHNYQQAVREVTREFWGAQRGGSVQSGGGIPDDGSARFEADRIIATLPSYGFA